MQSRWCLIVPLALAVLAGTARAQERTVTGTVTDSSTGSPLSGVTVSVQGGLQSAQTRDNGSFVLARVPDQDVTLVFRIIGYKRGELHVAAGESGPVQIGLTRDPFKLEEVVVTGQATGQERRNLANAISTVDAADLDQTPTPSLEQQLQGKVAGADIQTNSGAPGGGVQVRMRGVTSINAPADIAAITTRMESSKPWRARAGSRAREIAAPAIAPANSHTTVSMKRSSVF